MTHPTHDRLYFAHLRCINKDGSFSPYGGTTIAIKRYFDGSGDAALARCSSHDRYVKSIGRQIAAARLNNPEATGYHVHTSDVKAFIEAVYAGQLKFPSKHNPHIKG